jgi:hypothetical protein
MRRLDLRKTALLFLFLAVAIPAIGADEDNNIAQKNSYDDYYFGRDYSQAFSTQNYFTDFTAVPESYSSAQAYNWPVAAAAGVSQPFSDYGLAQPREIPSQLLPQAAPIADFSPAGADAAAPSATQAYFLPNFPAAGIPEYNPVLVAPAEPAAEPQQAAGWYPAEDAAAIAPRSFSSSGTEGLPVWPLPQDSGNFSVSFPFNQGG